MTDVDTSIYKSAAPPPNPLQMYGQVVGIQNAQQQNKLLQQQQDLRSAMGAAAQQATNPLTGELDTQKYQALTAADPRSSWNIGDITQQTQANAQATAQANKARLENGLAHVQAANSVISGIIGDPDLGKVDMKKKIIGGIVDIVNSDGSMLTPQAAAAQIQQIPDDPAGQLSYVRQHANQNLALQGHIEQVLGSPQFVSTGGQTVQTRTPAAGGGMAVTGGLTNTVDPGTAGGKVDWTDVSGQVHQGTYAQYATEHGMGRVVGAVRPSAGAPAAGPASGAPNGLVANPGAAPPGAAGQPMAPPAPAPPAAAPPLGGYVSTPGPAPGLAANQTQYLTDMAGVGTHVQNVQSLDKAKIALDALSGPFGTGKGTENLAHLKSVMTSLGIGFDESTLNHDLAKKYLLNFAKDQGTAGHSDQQLNAALGSNASTEISNKAALDVVKLNIGRENQAVASVLEQKDKSGSGHIERSAKFANETDPHAFSWNRYTPDEQNAYLAGLKKNGGMNKFLNSLEIAHKHNLIPGPGQQ